MKRPEIAIGALAATAFWAVVMLFSHEPAWIKDYAGPLATVFAATVAGWIAYNLGQGQLVVATTQAHVAERNWKTSNEKIVLELMERRLAIYREIRGVISEINSSGKANHDTVWKYAKAIDQVEFLFGPEVQEYLEKMRLHLIDFELGNTLMADRSSENYQEGVRLRHKEFKEIVRFYTDAPKLFGPYIRAHQKA